MFDKGEKKIFFEILDYFGVCLKNFKNAAKTRKCVFDQILHFLRFSLL